MTMPTVTVTRVPPTITARSMAKALARSPARATRKGRLTPSGVVMRWSRGLSGLAGRLMPSPRGEEVPGPEDDGGEGDRPAQRRRLDELAEDPLDQAGDEEHGDRAGGDQGGLAPAPGEVFEACVAAGEEQAPAEHHAGGAAEGDGGELGDAVRQHPGPELHPHPPGAIEGRHGAEPEAVVEQQQRHRRAG